MNYANTTRDTPTPWRAREIRARALYRESRSCHSSFSCAPHKSIDRYKNNRECTTPRASFVPHDTIWMYHSFLLCSCGRARATHRVCTATRINLIYVYCIPIHFMQTARRKGHGGIYNAHVRCLLCECGAAKASAPIYNLYMNMYSIVPIVLFNW